MFLSNSQQGKHISQKCLLLPDFHRFQNFIYCLSPYIKQKPFIIAVNLVHTRKTISTQLTFSEFNPFSHSKKKKNQNRKQTNKQKNTNITICKVQH